MALPVPENQIVGANNNVHEVALRNQRGFSLIEVMVATAILAGIALTFGSVFFQINRQSAKSDALAVADNTTKQIEAILANQDLCDNALRMSGGTKVPFNPANQPQTIDQIMLISATNPVQQTVAFTAGQSVSPTLKLNAITFQEQKTGVGESTITVGSGAPGAGTYNVYTGYVSLQFEPIDSSGQVIEKDALPARQIPLVIASNVNTGTIDYCYMTLSLQDLCLQSGGTVGSDLSCSNTIYQKVQTVCTTSNSGCPFTANCVDIPVVSGFDSTTGTPNCTCQEVCNQGALK